MGAAFLIEALSKQAFMQHATRQEKVSLAALWVKGASPDDFIYSAEKAQAAADTVRSHCHSIAPTYSDLMAGGKYDPSNPKHLTYAQAMNLENYLYMAVLGFGVVQIAMATGGFMIVVALALFLTGFAIIKLSKP